MIEMRNSGKLVVLLISTAMLIALATVPTVVADTASGSASVGNVNPQVVGLNSGTATVNPESTFTVYTKVRDNNTLDDIDNVVVKVYENVASATSANSKDNHYEFWFDPSDNSWHVGGGWTNEQGSPYIDTSASSYPSDLTASEDNYNFVIRLNGTANWSNDWNAFVEVTDTQPASDNSESVNEFGVAKYVTYSVDVSSLEWTNLSPATTGNACDNNTGNPIVSSIETNVSYDLRDNVANWSGPTTIGADNTWFNSTDSYSTATRMSTTLQDVVSNQSEGEALTENIFHYLDIPSGTPSGTYTTTFTIEVAEAA